MPIWHMFFAIKCMCIGKGVRMEYTKPVVLAQNSKQQSFAAGCPPEHNSDWSPQPGWCRKCERTQ